jgi:non-ribosomal peptide synthetase component F
METEGLIGFFVNVLPIRMQLDDDTDLGDLIRTTHINIANALDRQDFPFDELVRAVAPKRKSNRQPLVNVVFEYQRFEAVSNLVQTDGTQSGLPMLAPDADGILPSNMDAFVDNTTAKHDIILFLTEEAGQARFTLEYDTDLFDAETMQRWLAFLGKFAAAAAQNAQRDA